MVRNPPDRSQRELRLQGDGNVHPALPADIKPDADHDNAGKVGRAAREIAQARPAAREVAHPHCGDYPCRHQRDGEADAEARDQSDAEPELVYLETQRQHRNRRRARDQAARKPEHDDLACRHIRRGEAALDLVGMRQQMGVSVAVVVTIVVSMLLRWDAQRPLLAPRAPEHPRRDGEDQDGGCDLKVRLGKGGIVPAGEMKAEQRTTHTTAVCETVAASPSNAACATVPRTAMMKAVIIVLLCPGSKPCRAPSTRALDSSSPMDAAPVCSRSDSDAMANLSQRYFVIALNSSTGARCSRGNGPTASSRQFSM
jgi:hypothetical protein